MPRSVHYLQLKRVQGVHSQVHRPGWPWVRWMNQGMSTNISSRLLTEAPRVLVVDGSRVVRQLITRVLLAELPGVEVVGCGSGAEAEQVLGDGVFDFITIALRLPDMDGLELARFVRESAPQIYVPIVVVSGDEIHFHGMIGKIEDGYAYASDPKGSLLPAGVQ